MNAKVDYDCRKNLTTYWPNVENNPVFYDALNIQKFMCFDPRQDGIKGEKIIGKYGDYLGGFSYLNIYINKCVNDTTRNINYCHPQEKIDEELQYLFF